MEGTVTKTFYGSQVMLKAYCKECEMDAFIVDGKLQCCDKKIEIPPEVKLSREFDGSQKRHQISRKIKNQILKKQENKCIYCKCDLDGWIFNKKRQEYTPVKIHYDHFISWNYSRNDQENNLVAACHVCNFIKSDLYFRDFVSTRDHILKKRAEKWV